MDTADLDLRIIAAERGTRAADFTRACAALTAKRSGGAERLADAVNALLPALGMPVGRFFARLQPRTTHHATGAEDVTFEVTLNVGLYSRPLGKVAGRGEWTRLSLCLMVCM